jgi:manganese transport protein
MNLAPQRDEGSEPKENGQSSEGRLSYIMQFVKWMGPAMMVSIAYMDPGNYGTDLAAGAGFRYDLLWAGWLASFMAMLLQYLSGKLGIASGRSLPELVRESFNGRRRYVMPYWLAAEAAAAATDLAEYLGTVIGLNLLFGVPLLYASIFGALDVILLLTMMGRRFRFIEQYFAVLISILVIGILYNLVRVGPSIGQVAYHSVMPSIPSNEALLVVVGMIGATVMPHALFVHSWLSKNKMDILYGSKNASQVIRETGNQKVYSTSSRQRIRGFHLRETVITLTVAGVINAGILLIATPFFPDPNITVNSFVAEASSLYGPAVGVIFVLTLLASGLSSSALGTIAGQVIMEGLLGRSWNLWARRIVTRIINVFPTTIAILLGLPLLDLLIYSQVILSLMIPLPMIPLIYYTSKRRFMGELVNARSTIVVSIITVAIILVFNGYLLVTSV